MTLMPGVHFFWLFWMFGIMIALVLMTVGIVYVATRAGRQQPPPAAPPGPGPPPGPGTPPLPGSPLDILARRFASGEITAEEFQRGRDLLSGGR